MKIFILILLVLNTLSAEDFPKDISNYEKKDIDSVDASKMKDSIGDIVDILSAGYEIYEYEKVDIEKTIIIEKYSSKELMKTNFFLEKNIRLKYVKHQIKYLNDKEKTILSYRDIKAMKWLKKYA